MVCCAVTRSGNGSTEPGNRKYSKRAISTGRHYRQERRLRACEGKPASRDKDPERRGSRRCRDFAERFVLECRSEARAKDGRVSGSTRKLCRGSPLRTWTRARLF